MTIKRAFGASFVIGSKGFVGGGSDTNSKKDLWQFDLAADSWTEVDETPLVSTFAHGICIGTKGFIFENTKLWMFDPSVETNQWTQKANIPFTPGSCLAYSIGNTGYLLTGSAITKRFYRYVGN
jgi:outer membrane protein assembly factor BamB